MVGPGCRSSGLSCTPQWRSKADARADLRVFSEVQIPWGWLPFCLLQILSFLFLVRLGRWRASLADGRDTANLKYQAGASGTGCPSDSHLVAYMFGEPFGTKTV